MLSLCYDAVFLILFCKEFIQCITYLATFVVWNEFIFAATLVDWTFKSNYYYKLFTVQAPCVHFTYQDGADGEMHY